MSRALAALAELDRRAVEQHGGVVIYAGGDDLVAVAPASEYEAEFAERRGRLVLTRKRLRGLPALRVLRDARRHYWGNHRDGKAFAVLRTVVEEGGERRRVATAVSPALAAYGRSGIVLYWRSKSPLWAGAGLAHGLLDEKDMVRTIRGGRRAEKDVAIVASDAAGAAPLPNTIPGASAARIAGSLDALERLALAIEGGEASRSLVYDILREAGLLAELAERSPRLALTLLESITGRNTSRDPRELLRSIAEPLGDTEILTETTIEVSRRAELSRLLELAGVARVEGCRARLLLALALAAAYRGVASSL